MMVYYEQDKAQIIQSICKLPVSTHNHYNFSTVGDNKVKASKLKNKLSRIWGPNNHFCMFILLSCSLFYYCQQFRNYCDLCVETSNLHVDWIISTLFCSSFLHQYVFNKHESLLNWIKALTSQSNNVIIAIYRLFHHSKILYNNSYKSMNHVHLFNHSQRIDCLFYAYLLSE